MNTFTVNGISDEDVIDVDVRCPKTSRVVLLRGTERHEIPAKVVRRGFVNTNLRVGDAVEVSDATRP
jgi:hypothetical protein